MTGLIQKDLLQLEARTPPTIGATELGLYVDSSDGNKPKIRQGTNDYDLTQLLQLLNSNLIHNSNLEIWPEGTSFAAIANATYAAEGWRIDYVTSGVVTVTRDTDVPTPSEGHDGFAKSNFSLKVDVTTADASIAAGDFFTISQRIEGYIFNAVAQRKMVVSIPFKTDRSGGATVCLSVRNSGSDRSWVKEFVVPANTWTKLEMPIDPSPSAGTWDYTTGIGLQVSITIMAGSTFQTTQNAWQSGNFLATANQSNGLDNTANNFWICQPKLELGDRATIFIPEPIQKELLRCYRYYQKSYPMDTTPGSTLTNGRIMFESTTTSLLNGYHRFLTQMRATPGITIYRPSDGTAASVNIAGTGGNAGAAAAAAGNNPTGFDAISDAGAPYTVGINYFFHLVANARL